MVQMKCQNDGIDKMTVLSYQKTVAVPIIAIVINMFRDL